MKKFIIALLLPAVLLGCSKSSESNSGGNGGDSGNGGGGDNTTNYVVKGRVLDQAGNPVAGVRVRAQNTTGANMQVQGFTKEDGTYSLGLSFVGGWTIYAWKEVEIDGTLFHFRMGMPTDEDYEPFTPGASPVTRNFVWKLSGRITDRQVSKENGMGYFGGTIRFVNYNSITPELTPGTEVKVTFVPIPGATYPDGISAAGMKVTKSFTIKAGTGQAYYINDIPFTHYRITAQANNKLVELGANDPDQFADRQTYLMPSEGGPTMESGIGSPNEYAFYLKQ